MKTLILVLLFSPTLSFAQKTGILPYKGDKVFYSDTFDFSGNFKLKAKSTLAEYASSFNGGIEQATNKMQDFIIYEDDSTVVATVMFQQLGLFANTLLASKVTIKKIENSLGVDLENIRVVKVASSLTGKTGADEPIEKADKKGNRSGLKDLDKQFKSFINRFK